MLCIFSVLSSSVVVSMGSIIFLVFLAHPTYSQTQQEDSSKLRLGTLSSITYPLSWHVSDERGVTGEPGVTYKMIKRIEFRVIV